MLRVAVPVVMAIVMLVVMIRTWGSLGSALMCFLLIMMAAALLYQKFLTGRDDERFQD